MDSGVRPLSRNPRSILFLSLLSFIGFLFIAFLKDGFTATDVTVNFWVMSIRISSLTVMAEIVAYCFDTIVLLPLSLLLAACFFFKGYRKYALLFPASMGAIAALVTLFKMLIQSPRPWNAVIEETEFSFPSGHVTGTIVFFGLLTYFMWQRWNLPSAKILLSLSFVILEFLIGFSRLYLNVHWLSDIAGGYLLGSSWLSFSILLLSLPSRFSLDRWARQKHASTI